MSNDPSVCPLCGCDAKESDSAQPEWACGSFMWGETVRQSDGCEVNVLDKKLERFEALAEAVEKFADGDRGPDVAELHYEMLKALAEVRKEQG